MYTKKPPLGGFLVGVIHSQFLLMSKLTSFVW